MLEQFVKRNAKVDCRNLPKVGFTSASEIGSSSLNLAGLLFVVGSVFLLSFSRFESVPTVDEVAHLPAGIEHWRFEQFNLYRVNPPLVRTIAAFPAWLVGVNYDWTDYSTKDGSRTEFLIGLRRLQKEGREIRRLYIFPRVAATTVAVIVLWFFLVRVKDALGVSIAIPLGFYWVSSPNFLAHTSTIGPDALSTLVGCVAGFATWRYLHQPGCKPAMCAGTALGVALLTKLTWSTAVVTMPMTATLCLLAMSKHLPRRSIKRRTGDLLLFGGTALATLNAGYLFDDTLKPLGEYDFCSEMLGGKGCNASVHGNRFEGTWLANFPVPVPRNYLLGIDYLKMEVEQKKWSFLNGEWKFGSWPHYYVLTTLYKTPESTLLGAMIGLGVLITGIRRRMVKPEVISMFLFLFIPAAVCFASVSLQGGFNHHHRYVLMIYPPMFALAAYIASPVGIKLLRFRIPFFGTKKRSIAVPLTFTLVALSAASSLRVHPYYTSYFNMLSGGPENGWRLLGFSNIDWGQDILGVDKWLKANPDKRPLVMDLDYFGMNGNLFDIPTIDPPQLPKDASIDEVRQNITETQWWIISVKKLYNLPGHRGVEYLQQIEPVDKIAYAYHVYRIDPLP